MIGKIKKLPVILTALALSVAVLLAVVPFDNVFATAAEPKTEIEALKKAWQDLRKLNTELLVTPNTTDSACNKTADSTELTDEEKAAFGDYYYHITDGSGKDYIRTGGKDYSDKQNVKYSFNYKLIFNGSGSNFEIKCYDASWNMGSIWPYTSENNKLQSFTFDASSVSGKDIRNTPAISINPNGNEIYIGCIYVSYYTPLSLPLDCDDFTAEEWINAAENLDLTDCVDASDFYAALTALREFTEEGKAFNNLIDAWQNLKVPKTELLATPVVTDPAYRVTADSAELTDEEKAAFGDCYYHITSGGERGFTAAGGSFKDYSDKENVKYSFSYKLIFSGGGSNFEVKFFDASWSVGSVWPYTSEKNKLKTITSGAGNIGGKDVRKTYGVIVNPNGNEVYIGGIYVTYDAPLGMEESFKGNSLRKLVKAAKQLDLSAVSNEAAEAFKSAIAAAESAIKPITVNETKYRKTRQNLISAWQKLTYEDKELWAIPNEKYLKETTEEQAQRFGLTAEALGECYAYVDLKALPDNTLQFFAFDGSNYFDSLKGAAKLNVAYSFIDDSGKPVTGDGGVIDLQFNAKDSTYPNSWVHSYSISGNSENFAGYFNGTEDVTYAKAFMNSGSKYNKIAIGGIYKITVKNEQLPYGYKNMELPVLLEYAARLDLSKYETASAENFSAVLENAKLMSNMYVLSKCDSLTFTAKDGGIELDADLRYKELITSAMNVDLSKAGNKKEILNALWKLRLCTADGAAIENLKAVWEKTENSLPENYARLSVKQWIAAGDNIGKISNQALSREFAEELKQLKYYSTGVPEIATLKKYVAEAQKMNKNDFNALSWSNFSKVLIYAKKIVKTPSDYSQIYSDETLEKLLSVWGKLKYFSRTLYVDFSDYYQANPDVSVSLNPQDSRNTYAELVKNIKLDNGVDRAVKVVNLHPEDGSLWFAGKKLMSLNGYSSFEFYINLEKMDIKSGNGTLAIQLMNKDGTEWFDYYLHFSKSGVGNGWQRVVVPISSMINYKNGKRQSGIYMNENGFIVNGINFRLENSSGTFSISNIVALKECYAKAGVVPVIEPISIYREPEKVKVIPKNPFTGLDRGDPWGDEYRATIKKDVIKKNPVNKTPIKNTDSVNYYIWGAVLLLVILAAAGAVLVIILKKRTAHRQ